MIRPQRINVWVNDGGLGDRIATLPAIIYCLKEYSHVSMDIYVPDYVVPLYRHVLQKRFDDRATVIRMDSFQAVGDQTLPSVVFHNNYFTTLRTHLVDRAFAILNDQIPESPVWKRYPKLDCEAIDTTELKLPSTPYVVLTPGYTAPVRALPARAWNQIARWLVSREITPVWIGAKADTIAGSLTPESKFVEGVDYTVGLDLRDKTTILEAGKIIAFAKAIVGVDNGLIHLAGMTTTPIVAGFTSVDPKTRLPIRNENEKLLAYTVEPPDWMPCKFRQTRTHFDYQTDFRECSCGYECVESLTAEKFIEQLQKVV